MQTEQRQKIPILQNQVVVFSKNYLPLARSTLNGRSCSGYRTGRDSGVQQHPAMGSTLSQCRTTNPDHIRLTSGNPERHWKVPPVNRREIFRRDNHTCQYCGNTKHLTLDHVIPRSKGGTHTWDNVLTACEKCNSCKGDRLLHETGMLLKPNLKHRCIQRSPLPSISGKNSNLLTPDLKSRKEARLMLKLNYTDVGLYMERTMTNPELLIAQRVLLAMRLGRSLYIEPGCASFLLPADISELKALEMALQREYGSVVTLIAVDEEYVEVGISGSWIAEDKDAHEGMFLTVMSDSLSETLRERTEFLIYQLWQMSEVHTSTPA
jgi:5-methylcytosine-specific restriction endonuclease McrA